MEAYPIGILRTKKPETGIFLRVRPDGNDVHPTPVRNGEQLRVIAKTRSGGVAFLQVSHSSSSGPITGFIMEQYIDLIDVNHASDTAVPSIGALGTVDVPESQPPAFETMSDISNPIFPTIDEVVEEVDVWCLQMQLYAELMRTHNESSNQPPEFKLGAVVEMYHAASDGAYIRGRAGTILGMRENPGDLDFAEPEVVFLIGDPTEPERNLQFLSFSAMRNVILASAAKVPNTTPNTPIFVYRIRGVHDPCMRCRFRSLKW